ncbi:Proton-coupled amino acid transporter 1 [Habropoda laboriosa]|uniref:Proton-coupled amino acid transporter 1 n=1 Tax=Habropoda laboriosa TaxID=597456 RepID=A0A0L7REN1_9HYME|nr:Proton-coupled amino acid transporter 1 [Habropoda laboriosa]
MNFILYRTVRSRRGAAQSEINNDDSYDPYADRAPVKPISDVKSLMNLVKSVVGTGLFALPNAYAGVGLIVGVIGTILMGLLITVSLHILLRIHHRMCVRTEKPVLNYDEVVVASLAAKSGKPWLSAPVATYFIDIAILVCYIGVGAVCVVFVSGTIQESFDANRTIDQGYYALMLFPLFFLINMVKYLSDIAIVSIIGNVLLFCSALIGVVLALNDGIGDKWILIGPAASLYPKFIGTAFFSLSSPGIALAVEHDMKTPWNYTKSYGVLNQGMLYITLLHTFVGAVGYLKWGSNAFGNFIRNHPEHDSATLAALIMQALSIYFTYGLQCYLPIILIVNGYVAPAIEQETFAGTLYQWDLIVRLAITSLTCTVFYNFSCFCNFAHLASFFKKNTYIGLLGQ